METGSTVEKLFTDALGLDTASIGRTCLERAVAAAMSRSGVPNEKACVELLSRSPEEFERCLEELLVPETWFFRDGEPFVLLQQYLQEQWLPAHPDEKLRILSSPCATGEEPYSIAMTLLEAGIPAARFQLDAVDISKKALSAAEAAVYGRGSFRQPLSKGQNAFFTAIPQGQQVAGTVSGTVHFHRGNMVTPGFFASQAPYHIIFCRNLLIYLTATARLQVLATLDRLLAPGGLLFVGHAEMGLLQQQGFTALRHPRAFACRRARKSPAATVAAKPEPRPRRKNENGGHLPHFLPDLPPPPPSTPGRKQAEAAGGTLHAEALALADRGRFDEAAALCRQYLQEQPPHADVYCLMGLIHEAARHTAEAEECYRKALYLNPDHYEALIHASLLYRQKGDSRNAALYRRRAEALERRPNGTDGS